MSFERLPTEIIGRISENLSIDDLGRLSRTSKTLLGDVRSELSGSYQRQARLATKRMRYDDFFLNPIKPGYRRFLPLDIDPLRKRFYKHRDLELKITGSEHNDGYYFGSFTIEVFQEFFDEDIGQFTGVYDDLAFTISGKMNSRSQLDGEYYILDNSGNVEFLLDFKNTIPDGRYYDINNYDHITYGLYNNGRENEEWFVYSNTGNPITPNMIIYDQPLPEDFSENVSFLHSITNEYNDEYTYLRQTIHYSHYNKDILDKIKIKDLLIDNYATTQDVIFVRKRTQREDEYGNVGEMVTGEILYNSKYQILVENEYNLDNVPDSNSDAIERLRHPHFFSEEEKEHYPEVLRYVYETLPSGERLETTYERTKEHIDVSKMINNKFVDFSFSDN